MKIKLIESNTDSLEKAKELINDYCEREFGDNADFSDIFGCIQKIVEQPAVNH